MESPICFLGGKRIRESSIYHSTVFAEVNRSPLLVRMLTLIRLVLGTVIVRKLGLKSNVLELL